MLVSHAHSFRQQARLAVTLAWIADYTNILTFLACGTVTSHVSGTTSMLGKDVFSGMWDAAGFAVFILSCFFVGAGISGFCTNMGRVRGWESIFVLPIVIETVLLGTVAFQLCLASAREQYLACEHLPTPNVLRPMTSGAAARQGACNDAM